ncbi:MAG: hypothetical protein U1F68_18550 [Gammaproteobacteria bacterium]
MTLLDRWFKSKPKWQSPDPLVRKEAIKALNDQDGALVELARADQDPGVRRTALGRVNDLGLLLATAREDSEAGVREYAQARFRNLMVGREADSPPLATRLAMLTTPLPAGMADFLAQHGIEPELRLAALDQVHPESLLGDIACDDPSAQVRLAALVRIHSIDILERVAKHARNRDKRVSRLARERFAARSAELHQAARSREICAELETLPWEGETGASAARFAKLEEEWRHLEPQVEPGDAGTLSASARTLYGAFPRWRGAARTAARPMQATGNLARRKPQYARRRHHRSLPATPAASAH